MANVRDIISWNVSEGRAITAQDLTVTPLAFSLIIRLPWGGFIWNKPIGLVIEDGDRREHRPIIDVTRRIKFAFLGLGLVTTLIAWRRR